MSFYAAALLLYVGLLLSRYAAGNPKAPATSLQQPCGFTTYDCLLLILLPWPGGGGEGGEGGEGGNAAARGFYPKGGVGVGGKGGEGGGGEGGGGEGGVARVVVVARAVARVNVVLSDASAASGQHDSSA